MERLGLIAGGGKLPVIFTKEARHKGAKIIAFGIKGISDPELDVLADRVHWIDVDKFSIKKFIFLLLAERLKKMVMLGKIEKSFIFNRMDKHEDVDEMLTNTPNNKDYTILNEVTDRLAKIGITVIDGLDYISDLLINQGTFTKRHPDESEWNDIKFGIDTAKKLADLDIGQTITVKNRAVVTVEAMEGTDRTIKRASEVVEGSFCVIKVARPCQDMRWDVPLIGLSTIKTMVECNAKVLAVEKGNMFFAEKEETLDLADNHDISIIAV